MNGRNLNRVAWLEGMFLNPHHFQHMDSVAGAQLHYHMRALAPFHWGLLDLSIDDQALTKGEIVVTSLEAILSDGSILRVPSNARIETRSFDITSEKIDVYIGIRRMTPNDENAVAEAEQSRNARFWIRDGELTDLQRPGSTASVPTLQPNVRILLDKDVAELDAYDHFKLVEIEATGTTAQPFQVRTRFAPPLLAVEAWPPLHEMLNVLVNQMAGKVRVVAGARGAMTQLDTGRLLMGYTLLRMEAVLRNLLSTGHTPPFSAYSALVETAAGLSSMTQNEALAFPKYDHESPYPCFEHLCRWIDRELEREFKDRATEVKLPYSRATSAYTAKEIAKELTDHRNAFYLAVKAEMDSAQLAQFVESEGKLSAIGGIEFLVRMAVRGVRLERCAPPVDVEPRPGFEFFKVDPNSNRNLWRRIEEDHDIGVHLGRVERADVRLFVVTPMG
jgi:type VI secretion system protein ImpJ